jgi:XTP/dITP diphosphohydrolase
MEEVAAILANAPVVLAPAPRLAGVADPEETAPDYLGNARIKAAFWAERTGRWALADDSGLEVDALDGRPGVHSSRYAPTTPERNARLLAELDGVPAERRRARFVCTVVLRSPDGEEYHATGQCEGAIGTAPRGEGGFGYDPLFIPDGFDGRHLAELPAEVKNRISHRARALQALRWPW